MTTTKKLTPQAAGELVFSAIIDKDLVEKILREEVRALLVGQLDNVVVGEMAKMKIFKPGSSDLATMITNKVDTAISRACSREDLRSEISHAARMRAIKAADEHAKETVVAIRDTVRSRMKFSMRNLIDES